MTYICGMEKEHKRFKKLLNIKKRMDAMIMLMNDMRKCYKKLNQIYYSEM